MNASIRSCEQGKKRTRKNFTKEESQPADARWVQQAVLWRDKLVLKFIKQRLILGGPESIKLADASYPD